MFTTRFRCIRAISVHRLAHSFAIRSTSIDSTMDSALPSPQQQQQQQQQQNQTRRPPRTRNRKARGGTGTTVTANHNITTQVSPEDSVSEQVLINNLTISEPNSTEQNQPPPLGRLSISAQQPLSKTKIKAIAKEYRAAERLKRKGQQPGASDSNSGNPASMGTPMEQLFSGNASKDAVRHVISQQAALTPGPVRPFAPKYSEAIVRPSAGSGGVPTATDAYLAAAYTVPIPTPQPRHIMVVIDLNGTILYRPSKAQPTRFVERPHARRFLKYCVDTFTVVIWSSAREQNVRTMCKAFLTDELEGRVTAVWGRDKFGLTREDYNSRVQCYKRLTKIWEDPELRTSHPDVAAGGIWDQSNTVLIDDSYEKARSEPYNLIAVPEFFGDRHEPDNILPQVHDYLNWLSCHTDVSSCIRTHAFKAL
ncbi:phosphoprotein phosphatase [Phlyctema vagabunda]|uniref:Mitochondrial import inner membrane translocase subunit TIM50 n=1 Tax=Phlyctema vagabunda TaxID=108571 RepID=A0ABR4PQG2_9HELO